MPPLIFAAFHYAAAGRRYAMPCRMLRHTAIRFSPRYRCRRFDAITAITLLPYYAVATPPLIRHDDDAAADAAIIFFFFFRHVYAAAAMLPISPSLQLRCLRLRFFSC